MVQPAINPLGLVWVHVHVDPLPDEIQAVQVMKYLKLDEVEICSLGGSSGLVQKF